MKSRPSKKEGTVREMEGGREAKGEYSSVFEQGMTDILLTGLCCFYSRAPEISLLGHIPQYSLVLRKAVEFRSN